VRFGPPAEKQIWRRLSRRSRKPRRRSPGLKPSAAGPAGISTMSRRRSKPSARRCCNNFRPARNSGTPVRHFLPYASKRNDKDTLMANLPNPTPDDLRQFGSWLLLNQELPGATLLYTHYSNPKGGQNRQGHVKQSFAAAYRFLCEQVELRDHLSNELGGLAAADGVLDIQSHAMRDLWVHHLQHHANDKGEGWDYSVLRRHLPASLGGARGEDGRGDGGGGSGSLQRMLPLLARYMVTKNLP
jgi:hypothetical protein